nr:hypothetical protein Itr_chr15CG01620 [Ipomoea trifida]
MAHVGLSGIAVEKCIANIELKSVLMEDIVRVSAITRERVMSMVA